MPPPSPARASQARRKGSVTLVGAGPGDPDLLTIKALRALQDADVVFYDELVSPEILDRARRDAVAHCGRPPRRQARHRPGCDQQAPDRGGELGPARGAAEGRRSLHFRPRRRGGRSAARRPASPIRWCRASPQALGAAAQFEVPLTFRHEALRITFLTAHKAKDAETRRLVGTLTDKKMTIVVYMGMTAAPSVRAGLLAAGRSPQTPVGVFARVTRPDAQAVVGTLAELPGAGRKHRWRSRHPHHRRRRRAFRAVAPVQPQSTRHQTTGAAE